MRATHPRYLMTAAACSLALLGQTAQASEGGGGAYANGSEGFMTGALPPPGTYLVSYNMLYTADDFANANPVFDDFKVETKATILRAIHVTEKKILGGNWAMHAFLVYADVDVKNLGGASQNHGGMGDFIFNPLAIGWHYGNWHWVAGVDVYLPTGRYDKDDLANVGRNYVTLEPLFGFTYRNPAGYEFSMKTMFDHNYENEDTDYRSGNELHADFVAAKHFGNWAVGVGGYVYKQVGGDSGEGASLGDFKGRATALGPQFSYSTASGLNIAGRYQHEFDVLNRPEGDKLWLNIAIPL
ncbi:SphA family protein [Stutzerimonas azotifigens]|uniref:SphA family protein n=1 Tax=Stutzerimonas azotifigens TaxID=291995 RepID=UPI000488F728|nr:transporter [Stutzerimonas azotifigens]